jgi:malonyl-CoA/methylmalonyl-CoA synthetase
VDHVVLGAPVVDHHFLNELLATFAACGQRQALRHRGRCYNYGQLECQAASGAACLQSLGMQPGDRVILLTESKLPFLLAHLSVLMGGGVSLPLNPRFTPDELRYFLSDSGARFVVAGAEQRDVLKNLTPDPAAIIPDALLAQAPNAQLHSIAAKPDDPCLILYSSGTTGWPKGVVHTHANLAASLRALQDCWRITPDDVIVNVLPLFHIHGLSFAAHLSLLAGGCLFLEDAFHPQQTLTVIGQGTVFMAVPTIYYRFLEQPEFAEAARSWSNVRLFTCGSAPIRPEVLPRLQEILQRPVINRYGMTEAHVIASLPLDGPWPQGSVGLPLSGIEVCVRGDNEKPVAAGEPGRIYVRGPNLFREYWRRPEATQQAFTDGWFDTGDLGALDANGFLTLVGRSSELIITNGYNVYPQVVERVINGCPGVRESAVLSVPDARRGERVVAAVVRAETILQEADLRTYLGERLVEYQRPRDIMFVDSLPRNALGKVLRRELREQLEKMLS